MDGSQTTSHATASDVSSVTSLDQLNNVDLVNGLLDNQLLAYNIGTGQWENNTLDSVVSNNVNNISGYAFLPGKGFNIQADGEFAFIGLEEYGPGAFGLNVCGMGASVFSGTQASPGPLLNNTRFGGFFATGGIDNSGQAPVSAASSVQFTSTEDHDASNRGTRFSIETMPNGQSSRDETASFQGATVGINLNDMNADGIAVIDTPEELWVNGRLTNEFVSTDALQAAETLFTNRRKYDFDLTGEDLNGDKTITQTRIQDLSGSSYPVTKLQSIINGVNIDGSGYLDDFTSTYRIQVNDVTGKSGSSTNVADFSSDEVVVTPNKRTVIGRDADFHSGGEWETLRLTSKNHDNGPNWNAIGFNFTNAADTQWLWSAALEVDTNNASVDVNGDYTDFNHAFSFWVTDMSNGSLSWHNPMDVQSSAVVESVPHTFVNNTTTERNSLPAQPGMTIFNTTTSRIETYDGTAWQAHW